MSLTKPRRLLIHLASALCVAWVAASAAYVAHGWFTFSGFYRWLAEREVRWFGAYEITVTLFSAFVILSAPAGVLSYWMRGAEERLAPGSATVGARLRGLRKTLNEPTSDRRRTLAGWLSTIGLALIPLAAGAEWIAERKSLDPPAFEAVDLSRHQMAHSTHVKMTGVLQTGMIIELKEKTGALEETTRYLPLTAMHWDERQPVAYFLKPDVTAFLGEHGALTIDPVTPPFEVTLRGTLLRDGLPGIVQAQFEDRGLALAPQHYVLDMNVHADRDFDRSVAVGVGIAAFALLLTAGLLLMANGLERRRAR